MKHENNTNYDGVTKRILLSLFLMVATFTFITKSHSNKNYTELLDVVEVMAKQSETLRTENKIITELIKEDIERMQGVLKASKDVK
jgi:hypothetical protein